MNTVFQLLFFSKLYLVLCIRWTKHKMQILKFYKFTIVKFPQYIFQFFWKIKRLCCFIFFRNLIVLHSTYGLCKPKIIWIAFSFVNVMTCSLKLVQPSKNSRGEVSQSYFFFIFFKKKFLRAQKAYAKTGEYRCYCVSDMPHIKGLSIESKLKDI